MSPQAQVGLLGRCLRLPVNWVPREPSQSWGRDLQRGLFQSLLPAPEPPPERASPVSGAREMMGHFQAVRPERRKLVGFHAENRH